jgi:hypothetical protein
MIIKAADLADLADIGYKYAPNRLYAQESTTPQEWHRVSSAVAVIQYLFGTINSSEGITMSSTRKKTALEINCLRC